MVSHGAQDVHAELHSIPLQAQLMHHRRHHELGPVSGDTAGLDEVLTPSFVQPPVRTFLDPSQGQGVPVDVGKHTREGLRGVLVQVLHTDLRMVELRDLIRARQRDGLASPFDVVEEVEEALQHAVRGAQAAAEATQRPTLEELGHACIPDHGLHSGICCHAIVVQREPPLLAEQVDHRTTFAALEAETLEAIDGDLQAVVAGIFERERLQLLERGIRQGRGQAPRRLRS
mmetsp:Transcript_69462/g.175341  ORF Transcript_69462/g.175341 Transcript_69462/m.175341 type:complete len:230 (-) Transcript_69462:20-709(-)